MPLVRPRFPCTRLLGIALAVIFGQPLPLHAGTPASSPPDAATAAARSEFSQGVTKAKEGAWEAAYTHFLAAWKLKQHRQIALNLAHVELQLGKYKDAVEHFSIVLYDPDAPAADRSEATAGLDQAKNKLGYIQIDGTPTGARVLVDGTFVGKIPLAQPVAADPGSHAVELRLGDARTEARVTVFGGQTATTSLHVRLAEQARRSASGNSTEPSAWASLGTIRTVVLVSGGVLTLGGIGLGSGAAVTASDKRQEAERLCPQAACPKGTLRAGQNLESQWATLSNVAFGAFLGAGLVAAGTVALVLTLPGDSDKKVAFHLRPMGAGLAAEASW